MPAVAASTASQALTTVDTIEVTLPSHSQGDTLVIVAFESRGTIATTDTLSITESYTAVMDTFGQSGNSSRHMLIRAWAKEAGASEANPSVSNDQSHDGWFAVHAFAVTSAGSVANIVATATGAAVVITEDDADLPAATVSDDGSLAIRTAGNAQDRYDAANTPPTGHTIVIAGDYGGGEISLASVSADADTPSIAQAAWDVWDGSLNGGWVATTVVIPPSAGGATANPKGVFGGLVLRGPFGGPIG